jgi:hypothetical protein
MTRAVSSVFVIAFSFSVVVVLVVARLSCGEGAGMPARRVLWGF